MNQELMNDVNAALEKHGWQFRFGDYLTKKSGSEWIGRVVGIYSTDQTPEGYAVESLYHKNTVQIYPVQALEKANLDIEGY